MKPPALIRRREIWVPTIWGWLTLLLFSGATIVLLGKPLYSFLAVTEPVGAPILVVEGWMGPQELNQVVIISGSRGYERIVTTGGPTHRWPSGPGHATYADLAADYLKQHGLHNASVIAVPAPDTVIDRTFTSAVMVREWAKRQGLAIEAIDVISEGTHARRSRLLYQLAFGPNVKVGIYATPASDYDGEIWWRSSIGARDVFDQAIGLLWVKCCFWP